MSEKRVRVWVQKFPDRLNLMLQWLDPDTGKRKSKSAETADPDAAETARSDLEADLNHGRHVDISRMTWQRFREAFEEEYVAATRPSTQNNFAATLDSFEKLCAPKRLASITERTISIYAAGLRKLPGQAKGSTIMPSTVKVRLQFLHTALSWAVGQKMLATVPKFPAVKVPAKAPQPVPAEPFERLIEKAPDQQMKTYLLCGWLAGLRLTEALQLEWAETDQAPWIDLARNRIILPAEVVKAVKDQWVPIDPVLREALNALPKHGRKVFRFVSSQGRPLLPGGVSQRVICLAKRAGVRLTMKTLRKGFGCRYAGKVSAHVLQKLMRHANIKTTLDYYVNVDAAVEEAVFGQQCNTLRNGRPDSGIFHDETDDASPSINSPNGS